MKEARLNGFVLLYAHRDLSINFEHVIDKFSRKNRRYLRINGRTFKNTTQKLK